MHLTPSDPDITTLIRKINKQRLDLQPNFQRGEVWGLQKKQRLIDSILRGWHIPPIHVIDVPNSNKQEVLDGQQRLAAIRDFVNNKFEFNGTFEPKQSNLEKLDGLKYDDFDDETQIIIDDFTIRILTISDYLAGEPGELFYRLNQPTNLTAAEQRNAYFGEARQQVKDLSDYMDELGFSNSTIGFTNSRMAYDDTLAKILLSLELNTLNVKVTANLVTQRYRDSQGFSDKNIHIIKESLSILIDAIENEKGKVKLNKSTLFSWIYFLCVGLTNNTFSKDNFYEYFNYFESVKSGEKDILVPSKMTKKCIMKMFDVYTDRASSRVADTSSVKLRDLILWSIYSTTINSFNINKKNIVSLRDSIYYLSSKNPIEIENELLQISKTMNWGSNNEQF
ncbi:DUF262 domain-containing protein [Shewanella marina]|uniref:DUF262 domain-containing protein n=1 Tax=Shewanella marina TaxID=487319 RepID=UPI0004706CA4|nr:DUF262 domain-containing protein [Shewanella marina]